MVRILGISAFYHDSAAAIIENGEIINAAQEERFTRIKGDAAFPHRAIGWCLDDAGIAIDDVDHVVFYEQPVIKFERLLTSYLATAPRGLRSFLHAMPSWLTNKLWLEREIARELGIRRRIWFCTHHLSHAASAFFPSPFEEAAILTIDGVGEWSTATWGVGRGNRIELSEEMRFPNSLGLLYSAFTYYCGFKINSGEYKLMGLAPYGEPRYESDILDKVLHLNDDGSLILNQACFSYVTGLTMTSERFHRLFGGPPRRPESRITQREMDIAASVQAVVDQAILRMGRYVHERTGLDQLALAGGVALNCVAAGHLSSEGPFRTLWTQPAAGDAGGAIGAALWFCHQRIG
jgi:carbamoyltransferase